MDVMFSRAIRSSVRTLLMSKSISIPPVAILPGVTVLKFGDIRTKATAVILDVESGWLEVECEPWRSWDEMVVADDEDQQFDDEVERHRAAGFADVVEQADARPETTSSS